MSVPTSVATTCKFCEHVYVNPCDDKRKDGCPNWLHILAQRKAPQPAKKAKKSIKRLKL